MVDNGKSISSPPDRSFRRSSGRVSGLGIVDVFSEPYPDEEEFYAECSDTSSLSQMSSDLSKQDDTDSTATTESDSSSEQKLGKKAWAKAKTNPWRDIKKVKKELQVRSEELAAEHRAFQDLEAQFAEMKLVLAKAEEQKDEHLAMIQRANDERDLAKANGENEIYQLMERIKASEASRKELEKRLHQIEDQANRPKRRSTRGSAIIRGGRDFASRRWGLGRRNPNPVQNSDVPLGCIAEQQ